MKIAVGSDHAGFALKERVRPILEQAGHEVVDVGTDSEESTDYPVYASQAARMVADGAADRAVLCCGSGVGVSIVANKVDGVRAVNAHDPDEAEMSRRHNDANVLALAGRRLEEGDAREIIERFLATDFEGGRHERRVDQIGAVERGERPGSD
jgi:ribose 5-phosphate isomerase B